jgi:cytochrome c553
MSEPRLSDPHVLDQPWRIWASIAVLGIVLFGALLGIVIIPVVQGRGAGLDAFSAICRALGILPGSPAQPQPFDRTPPTPVSQVTWTPDVLQILARANTEHGRAKVLEVCVVCHEQGVSVDPQFPHLNGQSGAAIYKQLHDYRTGSRVHPQMTEIAKALEEGVIADVAAYYAGQPKRNPNPATLAEQPENIVRLVERGDPNRNSPPCAACHRPGSGGQSNPDTVRTERGILCQLQLYASGQRHNDVYARMRYRPVDANRDGEGLPPTIARDSSSQTYAASPVRSFVCRGAAESTPRPPCVERELIDRGRPRSW